MREGPHPRRIVLHDNLSRSSSPSALSSSGSNPTRQNERPWPVLADEQQGRHDLAPVRRVLNALDVGIYDYGPLSNKSIPNVARKQFSSRTEHGERVRGRGSPKEYSLVIYYIGRTRVPAHSECGNIRYLI